jgi:hypothetical protein
MEPPLGAQQVFRAGHCSPDVPWNLPSGVPVLKQGREHINSCDVLCDWTEIETQLFLSPGKLTDQEILYAPASLPALGLTGYKGTQWGHML